MYLLHYATEMRNLGFNPRIIVFEGLPRERHRCLALLEERGIFIESLFDRSRGRIAVALALWLLPWWVFTLVRKGGRPATEDLRRHLRKRFAVTELTRMIRTENPDILHVKGRLIAEAWPAFPPECTVFHVATRGQRDPTWTDAEVNAFRPFVSSVARVFAPGTEVAANFKREFGIERDVEVIYTMAPDEGGVKGPRESRVASRESRRRGPATSDQRHPTPDPRLATRDPRHVPLRFGTLCRLAEGKGIPEILEALVAYRGKHRREIPFTFAGEGPMEPMIREFAAAHELREVAVVPVESPAQALSHMDVFVLPSVSEAMPLAVVEALMCAKPCIVTPVGGIPDLVRDGVEGLVIEPGSVEQIVDAIERMSDMPAADRDAFGRRARTRYEEKCLPAQVAATVAGHYRSILRRQVPTECPTSP